MIVKSGSQEWGKASLAEALAWVKTLVENDITVTVMPYVVNDDGSPLTDAQQDEADALRDAWE